MVRILFLSIVLCSSAACNGGDGGETCTAPEPTLESLSANVMIRSCTISNSCHTGASPEPVFAGPDSRMDLTQPEDLCALIDRASVTDQQGRPLITCGDCEGSYFMIKTDRALASQITTSDEYAAQYPGISASGMPQSSRGLAADPLCAAKVDALCEWITLGCPGCP